MNSTLSRAKELWKGRLEDSTRDIADDPKEYANWEENLDALKALKIIYTLEGCINK